MSGHTFEAESYSFGSDKANLGSAGSLNVKATFGYDADHGTMALVSRTSDPVVISGLGTPTADDHAVNKGYVDGFVEGLDIKPSVLRSTQAALPASGYVDGVITDSGTGSILVVDGANITVVGTRILVQDEVTTANNGIYTLTTVGQAAPLTKWVLTRAGDMDAAAEVVGATVYVEEGTDAGNRYHCTADSTFATMNTDDIPWTQYGGASVVAADAVGINELEHLATNSVVRYTAAGPEVLTAGTADTVLTFTGGAIDFSAVSAAMIGSDLTNSNLDANANIAFSKLAAGTNNTYAAFNGTGELESVSAGGAAGLLVYSGASGATRGVLSSSGDSGVVVFAANGVVTNLGPGTDGYVLTSAGAGAIPAWEAAASGGGTPSDDSVGLDQLAHFASGSLIIGKGGGAAPQYLAVGATANTVLFSNGTDVAYGGVTSAMITNGTIVKNDISATAAIELTQLENAMYNASMTAIGLAADDVRLQVENSGMSLYDEDNNARISFTSTFSNSGQVIVVDDDDVQRLIVNDTKVRILGTSAAEVLSTNDLGVDITGTLDVTGDVTGNSWTGSERMWKDDLAPVAGALGKLAQVSGYTWIYNADSAWEGTYSGGIVADELVAIFPNAVKFDEKYGGRKVNMNYLHALAIEGIKELAAAVDAQQIQLDEQGAEIDAQDAEIARQAGEIEALQNEVAGLTAAKDEADARFAAIEARLAALE